MMKKILMMVIAVMLVAATAAAQEDTLELRQRIGQVFNDVRTRLTNSGRFGIDSVQVTKKTVTVYAGEGSSYVPYREDNVAEIRAGVTALLPQAWRKRKLVLLAEGKPLEYYIPIGQRSGKVREKTFRTSNAHPLTLDCSLPVRPSRGLLGRHIAMWQSHGRYYEQKLDRWEWQRARIFQTVEDLYTQSYVVPFLVPMLERAGANVLLPRERDANPHEVVVDAETENTSRFLLPRDADKWVKGEGAGFAHKHKVYVDHMNPFRDGAYYQSHTVRREADASVVEWQADLPETRDYAVYVSYQSNPGSTDDARYTIHHMGGETQVSVNQRMGGGTWIYLGTYRFAQGPGGGRVSLSTYSSARTGSIVTADAVRFGGGVGNVARYLSAGGQSRDDARVSGDPRFCEAARYWMQWAGVPDSIYDLNDGQNDYVDDYKNRGLWVNWLAGGSEVNPDQGGLNIPIDLSLAFHSDAGTTLTDQTVGTLAIYDDQHHGGTFFNGASTFMNHQLADMVQSAIVEDIRATCEPSWNRRQIWNKPYFEAWMPRIPAMLLELLSHQNFADMRYGLDPRFRFLVSRAAYKGILRFICGQRGETPVVQPLPVHCMALTLEAGLQARLSWSATPDSLEPTAIPEGYIVYRRLDDGGWDNGTLSRDTSCIVNLDAGHICAFKVVAYNEGGRSFDSEILAAGVPSGSAAYPLPANSSSSASAGNPMTANSSSSASAADRVLVINGFTRLGAPADFEAPGDAARELAGFLPDVDFGVPYVNDFLYVGAQKEFRRRIPWMDDDAAGFGDSYGDMERKVIAGNTFDYPSVHGEALLKAGRCFVSCSLEAAETGVVSLNGYSMIDLILGKQCQTKMGSGKHGALQYKVFSKAMQDRLTSYLKGGGRLMTSGCYLASDLWDNPLRLDESLIDRTSFAADQRFCTDILHYKWRAGQASRGGEVGWVPSKLARHNGAFAFHALPNAQCYSAESPDAIEPAGDRAATVMRYTQNNLSAAVAYDGDDYKTFVLGVPFECIHPAESRATLMRQVTEFLAR
ncbi:MAG: xanthan lyase [Bacteroidaceae bacterium]|nr:xanthan lyase [Bacteroidaceae bacterium]